MTKLREEVPKHMTEVVDLIASIRKFRDEREWMQFHNPKNLACSIAIEAAELLECFQWKDFAESEKIARERRDEIASEIADIAIYLLELSDNLGIDFIEAIRKKLEINAKKYPIESSRGRATKHNSL